MLVLSWRAGGAGGPSVRAAGLASAAARDGIDVRVVTRLAEDEHPARVRGCEVHAVPDAAPVLPAGFGGDELRSLGFAGSALGVVSRRLRERPVDLTVAVGADTAPVVARLDDRAGRVVVDPGVATGPGEVAAFVARRTSATAGRRSVTVAAATRDALDALTAAGREDATLLPAAAPARRRSPLPPSATGPVRLITGARWSHRDLADRLRAVLDDRRVRRTVTGVDRARPAVALVLDQQAVDDVLMAASRGVPVVTCGGPAAAVGAALGGAVDVDDERRAMIACAELLADHGSALSLATAGVTGSERARSAATATLRRLVGEDVPDRPALQIVAAEPDI